jgi:transcriptional regulator with XRE-family HTH domain
MVWELSAEAAFSPARLTAARELWRISSTELAAQVGVSQGSISHYENRGVRPSDDVLGRLARVLRVPVRYLFLNTPLARPDATQIHYRGRARIPMGERKRLEWLGAHWQELAALLARRGWLSEPKHKVPRFSGMSPAETVCESSASQ